MSYQPTERNRRQRQRFLEKTELDIARIQKAIAKRKRKSEKRAIELDNIEWDRVLWNNMAKTKKLAEEAMKYKSLQVACRALAREKE